MLSISSTSDRPAAGQKSRGKPGRRIIPTTLLVLVLSGASLAQTRRLDTTTFVVLGEGIAAGMADAGLYYANQKANFGALVARQMGTIFPQPLVQGPGFGQPIGYQQLPVRLPAYPQTSVRVFPRNPGQARGAPSLFVFDLSVPGMTVGDALSRRPRHPLIHDDDPQQTFVNLALGFPALIFPDDVPLWSQVEYAEAMNPTVALVALGYHEAASALVERDPARIPAPADFRSNFQQIVQRLRARFSEVIVCTIPDPVDSAYLTDAESAARLMRTPSLVFYVGYGMTPEDRITREGLTEMGGQFQRGRIRELPAGAIMRGAELAPYRARVAALNTEIQNVARENGAVVYDMAALFRRVKTQGIAVGGQRVNADYMGGFYSLDGLHPGRTGHALIANELIGLINTTYGRSFTPVQVTAAAASDPVFAFRPATGEEYSPAELGISAADAEVGR